MAGEDGGPFWRHAVVTGLAGCADSGRLAGMKADGSVGRRAAAVLALGRQRDAAVALFLWDEDPRIAEAAAIAIYDGEGIEAGLPVLGDWLGKAGAGAPESMVRRAMGSLLRRGDGEAAAGLAEYVLREGVPVRLRRAGLELLGQWTAVPRLDPADGFVRVQGRRDGEAAVMALRPLLPRLLELKEPELQAGVLGMALSLRLPVPAERLAAASGDGSLTAAVRVAALGLLVADHREDGRTRPAVEMALRGKEETLAVAALKALEGLDAGGAVDRAAELVRGGGGVRLRQAACGLLGRVGRAEAAERLKELLEVGVPAELLLDVWEAAGKYPALSGALEKSRAVVEGAAVGVAWRDCVSGGDAESGKRIVLTDVAANCVACHRFGAEPGSAVGPALMGIGAERTVVELVEALVNPGAVVADGYGIVTATLGDGTVVGGVLVSQDAREVVIRLPEGGERRLGRETVKEMSAPVSVMPPMEAILTRREIRDVVAYLGSLRGGKGGKGGKGEKGGKR
jgi:putative heme-binding domain-containing protein